MYPSRVPLLYVLHLLIIASAIMLGVYVGCVVLGQPLALLLVLALNFLPEIPLVPEPGGDDDSEDDYSAEGKPMGFTPESR